jgi:hypothetical protein
MLVLTGHTTLQAYLVQYSGDSSKLQQFVLLQTGSQGNVVKVVKTFNGVSKCLEIFLLNQQFVIGVVDSAIVDLSYCVN